MRIQTALKRAVRRWRQGGFLVNSQFDQALMGRVLTTQGSAVPPTNDPNLWGWYSSDTGISKDGSNLVYGNPCWTDRSGLGHHMQASVGNTSTWDSGGPNGHPMLKFGLISNSNVHTAGGLTLPQPVSVFLLLNIPSWQFGKWMHDGVNGNTMGMALYPSSNNISTWAGGAAWTCTVPTWSFGSWHILTAIFDGASSSLQMDNGTPATGNPGTGSPGGATIGFSSGTCPLFNVAGAIYTKAHASTAMLSVHKNWLAAYGGISI